MPVLVLCGDDLIGQGGVRSRVLVRAGDLTELTITTGEHRRDHAHVPTERSEEHTSELQSRPHLVCRLLLVTMITSTSHTYTLVLHDSLPISGKGFGRRGFSAECLSWFYAAMT